MSLIVGIGSGLIAVLIKNTAHNLGDFLRDFKLETSIFNYTLLFLPILGILSTVIWNKYLVKKPGKIPGKNLVKPGSVWAGITRLGEGIPRFTESLTKQGRM